MKKLLALFILSATFLFACNNEKKTEAPALEEPAVVRSATPDSVVVTPAKDSLDNHPRTGFIKKKKLNLRLSTDSINKLKRAAEQQ
jgi:hypothetical protein